MNRFEVRSKLWTILKDMLLSDLESGHEIPQSLNNLILEEYGWLVPEKSNLRDNLQSFVKRLQKWIEDSNVLTESSGEKRDIDYNFDGAIEKYLEAESDYLEVTKELTQILEEIINYKENYSQYFKEQCRAQEISMEVLTRKCQFLKLQFLLKLYGEENALTGHIALQVKLKKELELLRKSYKEQVVCNEHYDEVKNDKNFCDLFRIYKELRKIEKKTEIIGQM